MYLNSKGVLSNILINFSVYLATMHQFSRDIMEFILRLDCCTASGATQRKGNLHVQNLRKHLAIPNSSAWPPPKLLHPGSWSIIRNATSK